MERKLLHNSPISCFADEIDSSVDKQIALLKELGISWIEFRSGDGKGVADYTAKEAQALREKLAGTTTFIIAQRVTSVQDADRIIVLNDGRIDAVGTHEELLATNEIYREVYESQQKGVA